MDLANAERQLLKDSNRELAILDFLEQQIADPALKHFAGKYAGLVEVVIAARLNDSVKRFRAQAAYLTALAGIASFLASVQIGFIPIIDNSNCDTSPPPPDGCDPHSRLLRNVTIFLSYIALSFDALGALFSLLTARTLLGVSSHGQDLLDEKFSLDELIIGQKDVQTRRTLEFDILSKTADSLFERVDRHRHIMLHHTGGQYGVISFILLGMIFFFAALILEVIIDQPSSLFIPFIFCVFSMATILAWNERRTNPRLWSKLVERIWPKKREEDVEQETKSEPELGNIHPQKLEDLFQERLFDETTISALWEKLLPDSAEDASIGKAILQFFTAGIFQRKPWAIFDKHTIHMASSTLLDEDMSVRLAAVEFFTAGASQIVSNRETHRAQPMIFTEDNTITKMLGDPDGAVRNAAIKFCFMSIIQPEFPGLIPALREQLNDSDKSVRKGTVEFFTTVLHHADRDRIFSPDIRAALSKMLNDGDPSVRGAVIQFYIVAASPRTGDAKQLDSSSKILDNLDYLIDRNVKDNSKGKSHFTGGSITTTTVHGNVIIYNNHTGVHAPFTQPLPTYSYQQE